MPIPAGRILALLLVFIQLPLYGCDAPANQDPPPSQDRFEAKITPPPNGPNLFAGIHTATGNLRCASTGGSFWGAGVTVSQISRPGSLMEVTVWLSGVPASGGRSHDVHVGLLFDLDGEPPVATGIGPATGGGSGTATVERRGRGAVIRVEGTTNLGAGLSAVVECQSVEVVR